jgi:hypothetical protein
MIHWIISLAFAHLGCACLGGARVVKSSGEPAALRTPLIDGLAAAGLPDFQPSALPPAFASWHDGAVWLSSLLWIHALPSRLSFQIESDRSP